MHKLLMLFIFSANPGVTGMSQAADVKSPLEYKVTSIDGKETDLSPYKGKVVLIVNDASHCGNTKQYTNLENLYKKYGSDGLVVLGFPANEFGKQEPGTDEEIATFCKSK